MADSKITQLTENTSPALTDLLVLEDDPGGTPLTQKVTVATLKNAVSVITPYRISVTVASNNITLALKDRDGNDPSPSSPVRVQIGDTVREITSALSVTAPAATNWCNAGSAELATKEIDWFPVLGYNATDGVVIGFTRIPFGRVYSDFSTTSTNEKYCKISTITNAAASDPYVVIGRFAATLSAGAGYTWSVPTYTAGNLIHQPIYRTRWLLWTPTHSRTGTNYTNAPTVFGAFYSVDDEMHILEVHQQNATPGGTGDQQFTMPFTAQNSAIGNGTNVSDSYLMNSSVTSTQNTVLMKRYDGATDVTASKVYVVKCSVKIS